MVKEHRVPHQKAPVLPSQILTKIISKEHELEQSIQQAHAQANEIVQAAKEKTSQIISDHKREAEDEAARVKAELIEAAREEAAQIRSATGEKVKAILNLPEKRVRTTVSHLLAMVLPGQEEGVAGS